MDMMEKVYLGGFFFLLAFVGLFPVYMSRRTSASGTTVDAETGEGEWVGSAMEFLPLMMTSVYCALGIVWGYLRLLFVYLNEKTYQGQLNSIQ